MEDKMNAIRISHKCAAEDLVPEQVDRPKLKDGFVIINVKAFGVNESEVTSRKGESSPDFSYPRVLGIEGVGVIAAVNSDSPFKVGQKVATMMGGLGREIDGSYAEYTLAREENVIPFESDLGWDVIGALPEMLQTSYGSLMQGLQLKENDVLLIHGGTSTVGLMAAIVARQLKAIVISTTRNPAKLHVLDEVDVDHPLLDDDQLHDNIRKVAPDGVDKVLELVGFSALFEDMKLVKKGGMTCFTGALDEQWTYDNFTPFLIPTGTYLTSYAGEATDLPGEVLQSILDKAAKKELTVPIAKVYHGLSEVGQAQQNLESGKFSGKHVIVL